MANTVIQFRRTNITGAPPNGSLVAGQPAYAFNTDKLYLGNTTGNGILVVGGAYYTGIVDDATSANGANNLVKRDVNGDFASRFITANAHIGLLYGTANLANALTPGRYIAFTGDVNSSNTLFDGTTNLNLTATLATTGVVAATYGEGTSGTKIPVITVDSKGRITAAANIATPAGATFTFNGNTGTDIATSGDNINIIGGDGLSSAITSNTGNTIAILSVDTTVVRTTGTQTVGGDKAFTGNITFSGTTFYANTVQMNVGDNMIMLNADLPIGNAPTEDSGVSVNRGNVNGNAALYWDETNDWWTAQANVLSTNASQLGRVWTDSYSNATALSSGTIPSARLTGSYTGITGLGTITVGAWQASTINVAYGGTGQTGFSVNGVIFGGGGNGALQITSAPTEGKILQGNISGVPVFGDIDGGTY